MERKLSLILGEQMRRRDLSTRAISAEIGVSHTTINRILNGKNVSVDTLEKVSEYLRQSPADFLSSGSEVDSLSKTIAMIIGNEPSLGGLLREVAIKVERGEIPPEVLREIVRYAVWRINAVTGSEGED